MRSARARAAAVILALSLGASGCDLVDSLTPFGIGNQDYKTGAGNVNGTWAGQTATGGEVTFLVGSNMVLNLHVVHVAGDCTLPFDAPTSILIVDGGFTVEIPLDQGRAVATGTFTSSTNCSGSYFFEALPAGACPTAGTGTFGAQKTTN